MASSEPDRSESTASVRVLVICQLDRYANGLKPIEVERFLSSRGHRVEIVNTYHLSRASWSAEGSTSKLPPPEPRRIALYLTELGAALNRRSSWGRSHLSYYFAVADVRLRAKILRRVLPLGEVDLVICETPYDAGVLVGQCAGHTLYDCPTPWADELFHEGRVTVSQRDRMRRLEMEVFENVDHLAFHWQTYADYAIRHYGISGRNLLTLNFGCTPSPVRARFRERPRIVYLGSLGSRFIDLPLLSRLTAQYGDIDIYGGPPPDPALGLNYLGYAAPDILIDYQIGLITCTKDELRRDGFSAKHLEYFAHGLPVLAPEWRRGLDLLRGTVPYTEANFATVVASLSDENTWRRTSDEAYSEAKRRSWERSLAPLEDILNVTSDPPRRQPR
ncbi:MAG: hypothetical protein NVSMB16_12780 [Acidimicrobiales bacterium]